MTTEPKSPGSDKRGCGGGTYISICLAVIVLAIIAYMFRDVDLAKENVEKEYNTPAPKTDASGPWYGPEGTQPPPGSHTPGVSQTEPPAQGMQTPPTDAAKPATAAPAPAAPAQ